MIVLFGQHIPVISAKQAYPRRHKIENHPEGFEVVIRETDRSTPQGTEIYEITVRFQGFKMRKDFSANMKKTYIEDTFNKEAEHLKSTINKKDALGNDIVMGGAYGYSQNYSGLLTVKIGTAIGYTEGGRLQLKIYVSKKAIGNEPLTSTDCDNKVIAVKTGGLFRLW